MIAIDVRGASRSPTARCTRCAASISRLPPPDRSSACSDPNGAGKTTFVEILEGLRTATSGSVSVLGLDPAHAPAALRARLGVQLQTTAFMQDLTVTRNVEAVWRALSQQGPADGGHHRSSIPFSQRVDLVDKAKAMVRGLSGGQRQRLALAMAMLHDPDLYILDEPTSGLDPIARRQIHDILLALKRDGKTVLMSSHYLDEIEALADRVIILAAGEIVADGTPLDLLARAAGASTLWLESVGHGAGSAIDPSHARSASDLRRPRRIAASAIAPSDPTAAIVGLADSLRASGARLADLRLKRPSLEDVYLQLVGAA